ncbi:MAG: sigma 54-dependent Fis family transcriptional regulator [Deltaproteobacteria bacterium]|nr:sigma 54-dependent Fis family transcriptional regulator [Deltaproteobacteria bacterium]
MEGRSPHTLDQDGPLRPESSPPVAAKLVVVEGPDEGLETPLDGSVVVGTDPSCGLVLRDAAVSRRHVAFERAGAGIVVRDLGSKNGTFLGGARLHEAQLPLGAVVSLGKSAVAIQSRWHVREVPPSPRSRFGELIGRSVAMREVFAVLERVAPADVTVLVEGESGTGKELVARSIHEASGRAGKPYVAFDCGSIPTELAESELFGHRKGAFSGAVSDRAGAFQRADGGTIFLDEIGELPLELQPKLLRVLEAGEVRPVGEDVPRRVDVRVVAATNRDLDAEARRGRFRTDLYYRLAVVRLRMPPLRQRPDDVPDIVLHLLRGRLPDGDTPSGPNLAKLVAYGWPGNVRELRNVLQRAVTLATQAGGPPAPFSSLVFNLGPAAERPVAIGIDYPGISTPLPYKEAKAQLLAGFERAYVEALLERNEGNVRRAAAAAGLSRKHLYDLMRRVLGVAPPEDGAED